LPIGDKNQNAQTGEISMSQQPQESARDIPEDSPEALFAAIREQRKTDPLAGAKYGGHEIYLRLLEGMKDERGIHLESLLSALGSLAGYACQASIRARNVAQGEPENAGFSVVSTEDGRRFFFGDAMNGALLEGQYSVWSLAAGAAEHAGAQEFCNLDDLVQHTATSVGTAVFGIPRLPEDHTPGIVPLEFLKVLWPALLPILEMFCESPEEWPVVYGVAIQKAIEAGKEVLNPALALQIIMESAVPMARVDLPPA
jgi:hypothetical protein